MDIDELIERLLTLVGVIMEDASPVAIIRGEQTQGERAVQVALSALKVAAIGFAALAIVGVAEASR